MRNRRFVRFSVFCLLGCILWIFVLRDYAVLAEELQEDTEEVVDQVDEYYEEVEEIGSVSFDEENLDDTREVLSDTFTSFRSFEAVGSSSNNTYVDDRPDGLDYSLEAYRVNYPNSTNYYTYVYLVNAFRLNNDPNLLTGIGRTVGQVFNSLNVLPSTCKIMLTEVSYNGSNYRVFIVSNYLTTTATQNALVNYLNSNGFPEINNNLYWDDGSSLDPTPTGIPEPTPTVTPSPSPEVVFEYMEQRPDLIVIIFALGVFIGIFAGTLVLRVLK